MSASLMGCQSFRASTIGEDITRPSNTLVLSSDDSVMTIRPDLGGSITSYKWNDYDIMRPTPQGADNVVDTAYFALVPIVNRIPNGQFSFGGRAVNLDGNFMGLPDFIHGFGWRSAWQVKSLTKDIAELIFDYDDEDWPWPFQARQVFHLSEKSVSISLSVKNCSQEPMPADLGFHPFFPIIADTNLTADYDGHWVNNEKGHAIKRVPGSYRKDFPKGDDLIDTIMTDQTHYGWKGQAVLKNKVGPSVKITASDNISNLHIFFPPNADFVAIEPTYGRGNPFGAWPVEYKILQPDEVLEVRMNVSILT